MVELVTSSVLSYDGGHYFCPDVQNCRSITEAGLAGLVASSTLENFDLTDCRGISRAGLDFISRIPSLRNLKMDRAGIDSITKLAVALARVDFGLQPNHG